MAIEIAIKKDEQKFSALDKILKDGAGEFADFADKVFPKSLTEMFIPNRTITLLCSDISVG